MYYIDTSCSRHQNYYIKYIKNKTSMMHSHAQYFNFKIHFLHIQIHQISSLSIHKTLMHEIMCYENVVIKILLYHSIYSNVPHTLNPTAKSIHYILACFYSKRLSCFRMTHSASQYSQVQCCTGGDTEQVYYGRKSMHNRS